MEKNQSGRKRILDIVKHLPGQLLASPGTISPIPLTQEHSSLPPKHCRGLNRPPASHFGLVLDTPPYRVADRLHACAARRTGSEKKIRVEEKEVRMGTLGIQVSKGSEDSPQEKEVSLLTEWHNLEGGC